MPTTVILVQDHFTDVDGTAIDAHTPDIGGVWYGDNGTSFIYGNQLRQNAGVSSNGIWQDISDNGNDCYAQITVPSVVNSISASLTLRAGAGGGVKLYIFRYSSPGNANIIISILPSTTLYVSTIAVSAGDIFKLTISGGPIGATITCYQNGAIVWQGTGTVPMSGIFTYTPAGGASTSFNDDLEYGITIPDPPIAPTLLTAACSIGTQSPVASFISNVTSGTAPLTVNLTDTSKNTPTSWLYEFGDGTTSTLQNPSHTFSASGIYTVRLTATNAAGYSQYQMTITVKDASVSLPVAPSQASFTASPMIVAPGGTVTFTDTSSGTPVSWLYNFGDGSTSTSQNPTHAYAAVGQYIVTQTVTDGNGWSTQAVQVIVVTADVTPTNNAPTATITASVLNGFAPLSVTFSATVSTVCEYLWSFGDGTTSALSAPTHLFVSPGTYTVSLTVTNIYGSTTSTITIIVAGVLVGGAMGGLYNFYYIIDQGNDRVLVFHMSDGSLYGYFGGTGSALGKFHVPTDLTVCRPQIT